MSMSKSGVGFVIIENQSHLSFGVFIDGDLLRSLDKGVVIKSDCVVLVRSKESVWADKLAVKAVKVIEKYKLSALPVLNSNGQVVRSVNMRQLLQCGVV